MVLIPTFESEMSGVLSKLLDEQFLPSVARGEQISLSVWNALKENKLGVNK